MDYFIVFNQLNNFAQSCVSGVLSFIYSNTRVLIVNSVLL